LELGVAISMSIVTLISFKLCSHDVPNYFVWKSFTT
jgi:hypothetical protein